MGAVRTVGPVIRAAVKVEYHENGGDVVAKVTIGP
jgi:hypothetical protein